MKRTWWYGGGLILTLAVVMGLAGVSHSAHEAKAVKANAGETGGATAVEAQPIVTTPQRGLSEREIRSIDLSVTRAKSVALTAAVQETAGELSEKFLQAQIEAVLDEIVRQGADFNWGTFRPVPIVILYEDPTGKDRTRMGVGIAVPPNTKVSAPLRIENFRQLKAVRHVHKGPHSELASVYRYVGESLRKNPGRGVGAAARAQSEGFPVVLQILDDPTRFRPEDVRTVINIPVK